jgi:hypothetical protein
MPRRNNLNIMWEKRKGHTDSLRIISINKASELECARKRDKAQRNQIIPLHLNQSQRLKLASETRCRSSSQAPPAYQIQLLNLKIYL